MAQKNAILNSELISEKIASSVSELSLSPLLMSSHNKLPFTTLRFFNVEKAGDFFWTQTRIVSGLEVWRKVFLIIKWSK